MEIRGRTIALLIDSDNMSREYYSVLLDELSQFGRVTYRRLYGDFSRPKRNGWEAALLEHSIEQRQQSNYTKGKNATDSSMIIDAMDILYGGKVDCFCLATSDSDFTGLAMRFRNDNLIVIGAGEKKTPNSFRRACDRFIAVDELLSAHNIDVDKHRPKNNGKKTRKITKGKVAKSNATKDESAVVLPTVQTDLNPVDIVEDVAIDRVKSAEEKRAYIIAIATKSITEKADVDGWVLFSVFVDDIYRKENDFNPKTYGGRNSHVATYFKELKLEDINVFELVSINNIVRIRLTK